MSERRSLNPTVYRMASAHFVADAYSNLYVPLLPALISRLGLSLAAAGMMVMVYQLATSVSQLGFGRLADRWNPRVLLVAGPLLSVAVLSLIGLVWSPGTLAACLIIGGLGGAAFHPTAAAVVNRLGGSRRGLAMAIHITGGSIGYSLGPMVFAPYVDRFGLGWTPWLAIPGLILLGLVLAGLPPVKPFGGHGPSGFRQLRPFARPLFFLYAIVVLRTLTSLGFATFVPVLLTRRGWSVGMAGVAISVYLFTGSVGGFLGGPLSDRFGAKRIIGASLLAAVPFLALAPSMSGGWFVVMMAVGGFFLNSTLPVNVTFAHQLAPISAATVSSLMMGVAWGTGGLTVPVVGALADRFGIEPTLTLLALVPLAGAACAWPLPPGSGHGTSDPNDASGIVGV
ncbi:MAG: MFS transporter [Acidobacteria bacterium]|nr:MFS transporter [Acidobacteriota bacterium]